jgi:hypothetical protein
MNEHPDKNIGVLGYIQELKATVRECQGCGCLIAGNLTLCKRCGKEWDDKNAGKAIGTSPEGDASRKEKELFNLDVEVVDARRVLDAAGIPELGPGGGDLTLEERIRHIINQRNEAWKKVEDGEEPERVFDRQALINLSEELNDMGLRGLDPSSTGAAIIAIKTLKERINYFAQVTRKIMAETGIPTEDDETPESRLSRIKDIIFLIDFRGVLKVLARKEGVGK